MLYTSVAGGRVSFALLKQSMGGVVAKKWAVQPRLTERTWRVSTESRRGAV